jgi:hypothetical protein
MKRILLLAVILIPFLSHSQIKGYTEYGDAVILYDNGTWEYNADSLNSDNTELRINPEAYTRSSSSKFELKSKKVSVGLWINPEKWTVEKTESGEAAEMTFKRKNEDLYGMLISERLEVPLENMKEIAVKNARSAASDLAVVDQEYRTVNGLKVMMLQMAGTIQGIRFMYYAYYYSNASGTIQLLTYTSENLFETYKSDMEVFLNGLVSIE